jgi:hypothetical protein
VTKSSGNCNGDSDNGDGNDDRDSNRDGYYVRVYRLPHDSPKPSLESLPNCSDSLGTLVLGIGLGSVLGVVLEFSKPGFTPKYNPNCNSDINNNLLL